MGCCFAPVQRGIRQRVQNADDKQLYPSALMRIKTHLIVCLFRTHARPTTSAGKTAQGDPLRTYSFFFFCSLVCFCCHWKHGITIKSSDPSFACATMAWRNYSDLQVANVTSRESFSNFSNNFCSQAKYELKHL